MRSISLFIATVGYVGYAPVVPGTVGSVAGLVVYALVHAWSNPNAELVFLAIVVVVGVWSAGVVEQYFQRQDPGPVVIDEVAGMLVTLLWLPVTWVGVLVGFFAFRLFDIVKPFPANVAERLPGGWGVMADDLVAGFYAHLGIRVLAQVFPILMVS